MSGVRWCDVGDHPFKEGVEGAVTIARTTTVPNQWSSTGLPHTVPNAQEICPDCADHLGLNGKKRRELAVTKAEADANADE